MRTYKGWIIERIAHNGMWRASTILRGYYCEVKADTLQGLKDLVTHTINRAA